MADLIFFLCRLTFLFFILGGGGRRVDGGLDFLGDLEHPDLHLARLSLVVLAQQV